VKAALGSLAVAAGCVLAGAWAFILTQHVGFVTGLYWAMTTAATVGYGDVTPHNTAGRLVSIAVMLTAIPSLASAFSHIHLHRHRKMREQEKQADTESEGV
jgi:voltage-gated potassium channel